jgi:hypothetical protein
LVLVFLGKYPAELPGLGVCQPGQVINDPEFVERIILSKYRNLFIAKEIYDEAKAEAENERQRASEEEALKLAEEKALGEAELTTPRPELVEQLITNPETEEDDG